MTVKSSCSFKKISRRGCPIAKKYNPLEEIYYLARKVETEMDLITIIEEEYGLDLEEK